MTAKQRHAKCKTIEELDYCYEMDKMSADTFEFLDACKNAWSDRYHELLKRKDGEQDVHS